jgi:hypothetical protein
MYLRSLRSLQTPKRWWWEGLWQSGSRYYLVWLLVRSSVGICVRVSTSLRREGRGDVATGLWISELNRFSRDASKMGQEKNK